MSYLDDSYEIIPQQMPDHESASTSVGRTTNSHQNHYYARRTLVDSMAFEPKKVAESSKKQTSSQNNALLSLISTEDFEGIRN